MAVVKRRDELSPPFGALRPTAAQAIFIALAKGAPLSRSGLRQKAAILSRLRPGPIDASFRGAAFRLYPINSSVECKLLMGKSYDRVELDFLGGALQPGGTFVDVGAQIGVYSLVLGQIVGSRGRVISIEPNPTALERLEINVAASQADNVTIVPFAAGDIDAELELQPDPLELGRARIASAGQVAVSVRPLADILSDANVHRVDALKVDVEGYEDRVLGPYLSTTQPAALPMRVLIEENHDRWRTDCRLQLASRGYAIAGRRKNNILYERTL